ncbi:hypothetical protein ACOMHN_004474 [Nucella lapillus]
MVVVVIDDDDDDDDDGDDDNDDDDDDDDGDDNYDDDDADDDDDDDDDDDNGDGDNNDDDDDDNDDEDDDDGDDDDDDNDDDDVDDDDDHDDDDDDDDEDDDDDTAAFSRDTCKELEGIGGRKLVLACDGANGQTVRYLGLSDEYIQHSCRYYGAVAALERPNECQIPLRERCQHNLHFDLTAYGAESLEVDGHQGFSLKIFGTSRHRYMSLLIPKCESPLVKALRVVLDRSMMRNIFLKCFNTYKSESEASLGDSFALKHMKFSPRLFEVKLSQRVETAAYFQDTDTFVVAEGEAARCYNIHTGLDVNIGLQGLQALPEFIDRAAVCDSEHSIIATLSAKSQSAEKVCKDFVTHGLRDHLMKPR